ncbi:MAG: GNAT family N-acetyltransferase [Deinococcus sp.]|uniref:GNAT family N-acetyltransferase n=1 Tax=Deinococcus sp. TaxID=47478 RepID=UPI0026DB0D43|nr:GNAT family N-acetyltransferase [Deinococcus sp.]MDO4244497.1 GNAT family N-acetyltransferase [Deinococcus sp.]
MTLSDKHIRLLQAGPDDFETVKSLLRQAELHTSSVTPEGSTYWIAFLDGKPGGCIGLEHGQGVSLIRSTAVLPDFRSHGLGRALVRSALTHATLRGDHTVYLFSSEAGDYWKRFGFVPSTAAEVEAAIPEAPQVKSGMCKGWIQEEQVWKCQLAQPEVAG